jgi:HlyD family secretion protein
MKRLIVPIVVVALAVSAFWFRDRWLPQPAGSHNYLGYVEGEAILIGAPQAGRIAAVGVVKGGSVEQGAVLFSLDQAQARDELARNEAAIITAEATYSNLLTGKREPELAVIRAQIEQTEAALDLARKDWTRADKLASSGAAAESRRDSTAEQVASLAARLKELQAAMDVAQLPARDAEVQAAQSRIAEAKAAADLARQKLADLSLTAPRPGMVEDIFFDPGEWVSAGQPVVSLLAPDNITLRFFIPEAALAAAAPGTRIVYSCDGCGVARHAAITKVASVPEYTPPVIYSQGARAKLVYLVEAKPDDVSGILRPGLPVEVEPLP